MHKLQAKGSAAPLALLFTVVSMYFTTAYLDISFFFLSIMELYPTLIIPTLTLAPISKAKIILKMIHLPLSFTLSIRVSALSALFKLMTMYCLLTAHASSNTQA